MGLLKLRIVRFGALIHLPTAVGLGLSGAFPLCMRSQVLSLSFGLAIALASVSAFVFNDLKDVNVDRLNKPYRPSVRGEWSRIEMERIVWISALGAAVATLVLLPMSITLFTVSTFYLVGGIVYSRLSGVAATLKTLAAALLCISPFAFGIFEATWNIELAMFCILVGGLYFSAREIWMDVLDFGGDFRFGLRTSATVLGRGYATALSRSCGYAAIFLGLAGSLAVRLIGALIFSLVAAVLFVIIDSLRLRVDFKIKRRILLLDWLVMAIGFAGFLLVSGEVVF
ncbi:UbiA family prenyltransferase [Schaalia cardiffensis]